jgi:hypothetical protein
MPSVECSRQSVADSTAAEVESREKVMGRVVLGLWAREAGGPSWVWKDRKSTDSVDSDSAHWHTRSGDTTGGRPSCLNEKGGRREGEGGSRGGRGGTDGRRLFACESESHLHL